MVAVVLGGLSFPLFLLYDLNQIRRDRPALRALFPLGCAWLIACSLHIASVHSGEITVRPILRVICALLCAVSFALLIYSLFFAIPTSETYVKKTRVRPVYDGGIYAMCRHPGALWLFFGYVFLGVAVQSLTLIAAGAAYTALNLLYIAVQDRWIFPKIFSNYEDYQKTVPFLVPNKSSIRQCMRTITAARSDRHEVRRKA